MISMKPRPCEKQCKGPCGQFKHISRFRVIRRNRSHGTVTTKVMTDYDAHDDFAKSLEEAYRVIRERKAAGGKGWEPK